MPLVTFPKASLQELDKQSAILANLLSVSEGIFWLQKAAQLYDETGLCGALQTLTGWGKVQSESYSIWHV